MWSLGRFLPVMIGHWVPADDEHWMSFLLLLDIVDILFAPEVSEKDVSLLAVLIHDHHKDFVTLYPNNAILPKMHYMVHMPGFIRQLSSIALATIWGQSPHSRV